MVDVHGRGGATLGHERVEPLLSHRSDDAGSVGEQGRARTARRASRGRRAGPRWALVAPTSKRLPIPTLIWVTSNDASPAVTPLFVDGCFWHLCPDHGAAWSERRCKNPPPVPHLDRRRLVRPEADAVYAAGDTERIVVLQDRGQMIVRGPLVADRAQEPS